jgi:hypothetical protein
MRYYILRNLNIIKYYFIRFLYDFYTIPADDDDDGGGATIRSISFHSLQYDKYLLPSRNMLTFHR